MIEDIPGHEPRPDDDSGEDDTHPRDVRPRDVGLDGDRGDQRETGGDDAVITGKAAVRRPRDDDSRHHRHITEGSDLRKGGAQPEEHDRGEREKRGRSRLPAEEATACGLDGICMLGVHGPHCRRNRRRAPRSHPTTVDESVSSPRRIVSEGRTPLDPEDYSELIGELAPSVHSETVAVHEAIGRTLRADLVADRAVPAFATSAMDGLPSRDRLCRRHSAARPSASAATPPPVTKPRCCTRALRCV